MIEEKLSFNLRDLTLTSEGDLILYTYTMLFLPLVYHLKHTCICVCNTFLDYNP